MPKFFKGHSQKIRRNEDHMLALSIASLFSSSSSLLIVRKVRLRLENNMCKRLKQKKLNAPVTIFHMLHLRRGLKDEWQVEKVRTVKDPSKTFLSNQALPNVCVSIPVVENN